MEKYIKMYYTIADGENEYEKVAILKTKSIPEDLYKLGIKFLISDYGGTQIEDSKIETDDGREISANYMQEEKLKANELKLLELHGIYITEINLK